jgi:hypothetical protein
VNILTTTRLLYDSREPAVPGQRLPPPPDERIELPRPHPVRSAYYPLLQSLSNFEVLIISTEAVSPPMSPALPTPSTP